jgi:hypothetical protein
MLFAENTFFYHRPKSYHTFYEGNDDHAESLFRIGRLDLLANFIHIESCVKLRFDIQKPSTLLLKRLAIEPGLVKSNL